jgi:hypothetical protein
MVETKRSFASSIFYRLLRVLPPKPWLAYWSPPLCDAFASGFGFGRLKRRSGLSVTFHLR